MFRILVHPSSGACDLLVDLLFSFDVCWCYGVARLGLHEHNTPPQPITGIYPEVSEIKHAHGSTNDWKQ